jgi:hypothetical protein
MATKKPVHAPRPRGMGSRSRRKRAGELPPSHTGGDGEGRPASRPAGPPEFYLHGRGGQIRERDSHGHDPYPPRG